MPEDTYIQPFIDEDGRRWDVPIGVGTSRDRVPAVVDGYVRAMKAREANAAILQRQAAKYPTAAEMGGTPGSVAPQPTVTSNYPGGDSSRTATQVMQDQAANVLSGIPKAVTSIPGTVAATLDAVSKPSTLPAFLKNAITDAVQPAVPVAKAFIGQGRADIVPGPESPEWVQAAQGAGTMLGSAELPNAIGGLKAGAITAGRKVFPIPALEKAAAENVARALAPSSLESKATVAKIAPELAQRGVSGVTGNAIDADIMSKLSDASDRLATVEKRVIADPRPEYQVSMRPLVEQVDASLDKLKEYPEINSDAISALEDIKKSFERLPDYAPIDRAIKLRRTLDDAIQEAGGFKQASTAAERVKMKVQRGGADLLRGAINDVDPELRIANQDYSLYRNAADIVERRKLAKVGVSDSGLPNRGGLLDDILAGWLGHAVAGPAGTAVAEGLNLARQTRGFANVKSKAQTTLADILRQPQPQPRGLLAAGTTQLPAPDNSGISVTTGSPLAPSSYEDIISRSKAGAPPKGPNLRLSHIEMDSYTGKPKYYIYTDSAGQPHRFAAPQD